eukprot:5437470-Amphidinium_carterae.1
MKLSSFGGVALHHFGARPHPRPPRLTGCAEGTQRLTMCSLGIEEPPPKIELSTDLAQCQYYLY